MIATTAVAAGRILRPPGFLSTPHAIEQRGRWTECAVVDRAVDGEWTKVDKALVDFIHVAPHLGSTFANVSYAALPYKGFRRLI